MAITTDSFLSLHSPVNLGPPVPLLCVCVWQGLRDQHEATSVSPIPFSLLWGRV